MPAAVIAILAACALFFFPSQAGAINLSGGIGQVSDPRSVPEKIMDQLMRSGIRRAAAAGITGNALQESGWNPASEGMGGGGLWGFTSPPVSLEDLKNFAQSRGQSWKSVSVQTKFLLRNLHIHDSSFRARLNSIRSPEKAAEVFCWEWERPAEATANLERRQQGARRAWKLSFRSNPGRESSGKTASRKSNKIKIALHKSARTVAERIFATKILPSGGISPEGCDRFYTAAFHRKWARQYMRRSSIPEKIRRKHRLKLECALGPGHHRAMQKTWKRVLASLLPANHDLWIRIGLCEQPGPGYRGVHWSHPGPTYQGGLGFWYGTWDAFRYPGMPEDAGSASWRQQMRVANRLLRAYGTSPWGCA